MIEKQSKIDSAMETVTNTAIGFSTAMIGNAIILPWLFDIELDMAGNVACASAYTAISIARQYTLRRIFNGRSVWQSVKLKVPTPSSQLLNLSFWRWATGRK
jgi:hypothetical protein